MQTCSRFASPRRHSTMAALVVVVSVLAGSAAAVAALLPTI
jgi:hypothetical protein